jgi:hypothetical protein
MCNTVVCRFNFAEKTEVSFFLKKTVVSYTYYTQQVNNRICSSATTCSRHELSYTKIHKNIGPNKDTKVTFALFV